MSYKYSFADNEIYGADDLNAVTKRLVSSGVADSFEDGVAYNVSKLNESGEVIYTSGVVPESCLTLKVVASTEGRIMINPGIAFFDDGSVIEIEAGGEELSYTPGVKNYVYLKNDLQNNNISYPYCGTEAPQGDFVLLAEIDENGVIFDKRVYAKGKLPGYQSVSGNIMRIQDGMTITSDSTQSFIEGSATFDIGNNNFQYILSLPTDGSSECLGMYNIADKTYAGFAYYSDNYVACNNTGLYTYCDRYVSTNIYRTIRLSLENGVLTVNLKAYRTTDNEQFCAGSYYFPINLILF